jgi:hypothetical protein
MIKDHEINPIYSSMMVVLTMLQQCFVGSKTSDLLEYHQHDYQEGALTSLPDEILEMIANKLNRHDFGSLRSSNKRLATMTTHLLAARCPSDRTCVNAEDSLTTLIKGSKIPLLNGTITSLTLSAPSWKSPLASYSTGLQEVLLLRLTCLRLHSIRIAQSSDLLSLLTSHAASIRELYLRNVHVPEMQDWREILLHNAKMHRLQRLELRQLFYTANQTAIFALPRSTYGEHSSALERMEYDVEAKLLAKESNDPAVAHSPQEIGCLVDEFFTDAGELQKDFGHELLLATEQGSWVQAMKKRLLWS